MTKLALSRRFAAAASVVSIYVAAWSLTGLAASITADSDHEGRQPVVETDEAIQSADMLWRLAGARAVGADPTKRGLAQSSPIRVIPPATQEVVRGGTATFTIELKPPTPAGGPTAFYVFYSSTDDLMEEKFPHVVAGSKGTFPLTLKVKADAAVGSEIYFVVRNTALQGTAAGSLIVK